MEDECVGESPEAVVVVAWDYPRNVAAPVRRAAFAEDGDAVEWRAFNNPLHPYIPAFGAIDEVGVEERAIVLGRAYVVVMKGEMRFSHRQRLRSGGCIRIPECGRWFRGLRF